MATVVDAPSDHQWSIVRTCVWVAAATSMLGAGVIIFLYARHRSIRSFSVRLLVYLSIADLFAAGSHFLHAPPAWDGENAHRRHFPCQLQAVCQHFFFLASFLWTLCFAINQYLQVCNHERASFKYEPLYHMMAWGLPLVSCVWVAAVDGFGPTDLWCWIPLQHQVLRWVSFYGPLLLIVVTVGVLAALSMWELRSEDHRRSKAIAASAADLLDVSGQEARSSSQARGAGRPKLGARWHSETVLYLVAFVLIRLPGMIHRLFELFPRGTDATSSHSLFTLELLHGIFSPLQGFINCVLFLSNRTVRSHLRLYRYGSCTACCGSSGSGDQHSQRATSRGSSRHAAIDGDGSASGPDDTTGLLTDSGATRDSLLDTDNSNAVHGPDLHLHMRDEDPAAPHTPEPEPDAEADAAAAAANALHERFSSFDSAEHSNLEPFPACIGKDDIVPIFVGTWNMGRMPPPSVHELRSFIPRDGYDVYAIGVQECVYSPPSPPHAQSVVRHGDQRAVLHPPWAASTPIRAVSYDSPYRPAYDSSPGTPSQIDMRGGFDSHALSAFGAGMNQGTERGARSLTAAAQMTAVGHSKSSSQATSARKVVVVPAEEHFFGLVHTLLGDAFVTVATVSLGGIRLIVLARRSLHRVITQVHHACRVLCAASHMVYCPGFNTIARSAL